MSTAPFSLFIFFVHNIFEGYFRRKRTSDNNKMMSYYSRNSSLSLSHMTATSAKESHKVNYPLVFLRVNYLFAFCEFEMSLFVRNFLKNFPFLQKPIESTINIIIELFHSHTLRQEIVCGRNLAKTFLFLRNKYKLIIPQKISIFFTALHILYFL